MQFSERNEYRQYFVERFGIPAEILANYLFCERGKSVWAYTGNCPDMSNVEVVGIRALRIKNIIKPTTSFLRIIGKYCTKNVVSLDGDEAVQFLKGEEVHGDFRADPGFVVVKSGEDVLGCGYFTGERLISQIPRKYQMQDSWL